MSAPRMTRQHFVYLAEIIASLDLERLRYLNPQIQRSYVANQFATMLRATNPNFNSSRFLDACVETERKEAI